MTRTHAEQLLRLVRKQKILRSQDLAPLAISRATLTRLERQGLLRRIGRGLYIEPESDLSEHSSLAEAAKRVPTGVICLLSALQFHELTTQVPHEVWLAIPNKAHKPVVDWPPLRIVRYSPRALEEGVEQHRLERVPVSITSPARTVADCFKYRGKIGLDVALEALRDYMRQRNRDLDALWKAASLQRVANVMRPYMEALT